MDRSKAQPTGKKKEMGGSRSVTLMNGRGFWCMKQEVQGWQPRRMPKFSPNIPIRTT